MNFDALAIELSGIFNRLNLDPETRANLTVDTTRAFEQVAGDSGVYQYFDADSFEQLLGA